MDNVAKQVENVAEHLTEDIQEPHHEGVTTKVIEKQTKKIPSGFFLALGLGSILASLGLQAAGKQKASNFVGLWVPTILIMGLYNKLVKLEGSEKRSAR